MPILLNTAMSHPSVKKLRIICVILSLAVSACNLPSSTPSDSSGEEQLGTSVAQTMEAIGTQRPAATSTSTSTSPKTPPTATVTPTPTATPTATSTPTPTYALPLLTFEGDVNCRSGPGLDYIIVYTYDENETAEIVGKHPSSDFWVVKNPSGEGACWVVGEYASASGSLWAIPTMTPPPTETPSPPAAPTLKEYNYACAWNGSNTTMTMTIKWSDWADNESGYRIYRNGVMIADLGANTTTYVDIFAVDSTQSVSYGIEAYNSTGSSGQATFSASCQ